MSEYANLILAILLAILAFAFYRSNKALKKAKDGIECLIRAPSPCQSDKFLLLYKFRIKCGL